MILSRVLVISHLLQNINELLVEPTILVVNANFFGDLVVHQSFVCMRVL